jgi:hypothetical protein
MFGSRIVGGHRVDEVISFLQKAIRRGQVTEAIQCGRLMYNDGYWNAVFNRLFVITMEDVAGNLLLAEYVDREYSKGKTALGKQRLTDSKSIPECETTMVRVITALATSPKTRCLNHWLGVTRKTLLDTPDNFVPTDQCLVKFRQTLGQDVQQALEWAVRLIILDQDKALWQAMVQWSKTGPYASAVQVLSRRFKQQNEGLAIAYALALTHGDMLGLPFERKPVVERSAVTNQEDSFLVIPDYALDKHTAAGKRMRRGIQHFFEVGAVVVDELFPDPWVETVKAWYLQREADGTKPKSSAIMDDIKKKWFPHQGKHAAPPALEIQPPLKKLKSGNEVKQGKRALPVPTQSARKKVKKAVESTMPLINVSKDPMQLQDLRYAQMPVRTRNLCFQT